MVPACLLLVRHRPTVAGRVADYACPRAYSGESYVLDLIDGLLDEVGKRQHRFDCLLGEPDVDGIARRARERVDGRPIDRTARAKGQSIRA
jgi:hypothetical protein